MTTTGRRATGPRRVRFKSGMEPERVERRSATSKALTARLSAYQQAIPPTHRHLTIGDLPQAQTGAVVGWLNTDKPALWLGGKSFKGKTATGWLLCARYAVETGRTWAVVKVDDYLTAKRGIQTPEEAALIRRCETVAVLVLDEWPLRLTENTLSYLRTLLDTRATRGHRTVITANGAPGVSPVLLNHPDAAVADAARSLHNRIKVGTYFPYPESLPDLP